MIVAYKYFKERKLKSVLIGQVHDEIIADVFPGELEIVRKILTYSLEEGGRKEYNRRFNGNFDFPLSSGFKAKDNW